MSLIDPHLVPHDYEAEQQLLGGLLVNPAQMDVVGEIIEAAHFHHPAHGKLFAAMQAMAAQGFRPTPQLLARHLASDFATVGGGDYLKELAGAVLSVQGAVDYARVVRDLSLRRALVRFASVVAREACRVELDNPADAIIADADEELFRLRGGTTEEEAVRADRVFGRAVSRVDRRRDGSIGPGLSVGFTALDAILGGLQGGDLVILAGRPSMGKSALATAMARRIADAERARADAAGKPDAARAAAILSLEMSAEQVADRQLAEVAGVRLDRLRQVLTDDEAAAVRAAGDRLARLPLFIDDTPALTGAALRRRCRRLARQGAGLAVVIVDYLQLLSGAGGKSGENRTQEVSRITAGLKALAKELNVPVIALSQLSRAVESREDKRPQLADLRESGSIEQDADAVLFVYREEYYLARSEPSRKADEDERSFMARHAAWHGAWVRAAGVAEVIVAKHRMGPIGTAQLAFESRFARFDDLADRVS